MRNLTPYPSPHFGKQCESVLAQSFCACFSGELVLNVDNAPLGVVKRSGTIANVFLSCEKSGKDDTNSLGFSGEVYINSVSCLTTPPAIGHVSGEASQQKTTKILGDTGIAQAVMDTDYNTFNPGDVLTYKLTLVRTSSPTTEILNPCIVVELEPDSP